TPPGRLARAPDPAIDPPPRWRWLLAGRCCRWRARVRIPTTDPGAQTRPIHARRAPRTRRPAPAGSRHASDPAVWSDFFRREKTGLRGARSNRVQATHDRAPGHVGRARHACGPEWPTATPAIAGPRTGQ